MSEASKCLGLTDHFRKAGWLPISQEVLDKWLKETLSTVVRIREPLLPVIQEFKVFIENNGKMYMGFHEMFEGASGSYVCNTWFIVVFYGSFPLPP
jgi:hypothetical protein